MKTTFEHKYKIGDKVLHEGKIKTIGMINFVKTKNCKSVKYRFYILDTCVYTFDWFEESELSPAPKEILDKEEKAYLSAIIKPFRDKVKSIVKYKVGYNYSNFICIYLKNKEIIDLPYFKPNTMYKGMKCDKEYTLGELGL